MAAGRCNIAAGGLRIKSAQYGRVEMSDTSSFTIAINPVDIARSIILCANTGEGSGYDEDYCLVTFQDSTHLRVARGDRGSEPIVSWSVFELEGFKSLQSLICTGGSGSELLNPINTVNPSKTLLIASSRYFKQDDKYATCGSSVRLAPNGKGIYMERRSASAEVNCFVIELL